MTELEEYQNAAEGEIHRLQQEALADRDHIEDLGNQILLRPEMWAYTREALVAQLGIILDCLGFEGRQLYDCMREGAVIMTPGDPIDKDFIAKVAHKYLEIRGMK